MRTIVFLGAIALARAGEVTVLTEKTFDSTVYESGKSVFVKFYAPWCGHCKAMKPAWDQLGGEFTDHANVVVADIDCTVEKSLCSKHGVKGYPTVKYYMQDDGTDYKGGRDFDTLKKFTEETLTKPICNSDNKSACTPEDLAELEKYEKMSPEERKAEVDRIEKEVKAANDAHESLLESLQKQYEESKKETEETTATLSKPLRYLKKIKDGSGKDEL